MSLDTVDYDPPLASSIDRPHRGDVAGQAGAQVGLLAELHQPVHAVIRVGQHVFVESRHSGIVVLYGMGDLIARIF